VVEILS